MRDPYKFLNVPYDVTDDVLKARFRGLAKKLHGDKDGSDEMMKLVNEANDQIKFNIKSGLSFTSEAEQPPPKAEEKPRSESRQTHEESAHASRDPPPNDPPENEPEPNPGWGPNTHTWDVGGGTYTNSSSGTYSSRPYYSSRWRWWAGGGAAFVICLTIISSGSHSPSSPGDAVVKKLDLDNFKPLQTAQKPALPAEQSPSIKPAAPEGRFDLRDFETSYTIGPGDRYSLSLPYGLVRVETLSGQLTLFTMNGELWRSCTGRFTAKIESSPAFHATACGQAPVIFHMVSAGPIPQPEQHIVTTRQPGSTHPAVVVKSVPNGYSTSSPGVSVPMQ